MSRLVINSVWAGLYLVYHYLNIMKNTSNISKETQQSYTYSYPIPTFIYIYSLALTGPSIFPYLKNPLLRSFAKKLIKCYFTGIITTVSSFCPTSYSYRIKHSGKNHQISETETSDNKFGQTISRQTSSYDEKISHIKVCPM